LAVAGNAQNGYYATQCGKYPRQLMECFDFQVSKHIEVGLLLNTTWHNNACNIVILVLIQKIYYN